MDSFGQESVERDVHQKTSDTNHAVCFQQEMNTQQIILSTGLHVPLSLSLSLSHTHSLSISLLHRSVFCRLDGNAVLTYRSLFVGSVHRGGTTGTSTTLR